MMPGVERAVRFDRTQKNALLIGVAALAISILLAFFNRQQFFRSYLIGYVFWVSLALGSLGILLLHNLVGGRWGALIRRFLVSGVWTLPVMALLILPIFAGIPMLYEWSHADVVRADPILQHKQSYLNVPFFVGRTILYFVIWIGIGVVMKRREAVGPASRIVKGISGPALIIFVFTVTFAAVDWIMTLEPHWFSTIYGAIFLVGQALETFAFCIALLALWENQAPFAEVVDRDAFHDLGNLMLTFTVLWAYTSFSQFLIIWSGHIPEETVWYIRRSNGGWQFVAFLLTLFHFAVPFFVLLSRRVKRNGSALARVALAVIVMRFVDLFYWIEPAFERQGVDTLALDLLAVVGIGGIWMWAFFFQLRRGPLLNIDDPRLRPAEGGH